MKLDIAAVRQLAGSECGSWAESKAALKFMLELLDDSALSFEGEDATLDFTLKPNHFGCWITVENIAVHIIRADEGVVVDLHPTHYIDFDTLATTYATFGEAELDPS